MNGAERGFPSPCRPVYPLPGTWYHDIVNGGETVSTGTSMLPGCVPRPRTLVKSGKRIVANDYPVALAA